MKPTTYILEIGPSLSHLLNDAMNWGVGIVIVLLILRVTKWMLVNTEPSHD